MQFWPGENCACVTEIIEFPQLKALNFFLVGGDMDELLTKMHHAVIEWARANGCKRVALVLGRKGWERALKPMGYTKALSVMFKNLKDN